MTIISLTDCCHLLAIDPKTLRHWMRLSHLEAKPSPLDARCKYLTPSQLQQLAVTHHRSLETKAERSQPLEISVLPTPTPQVCTAAVSDVRSNLGGGLLSIIMSILGFLLKKLMGRPLIAKSVIAPDFSAAFTSLTTQLASLQVHVATLQHQLTLLTDQLQNEQQWRATVASTTETKSLESSLDLSLEKPQEPSLESSLDLSLEKPQEPSLESSLDLSLEKPQEPSLESSLDLSLEKPQEPSLESSLDLSLEKPQESSREKMQARAEASVLSKDSHRRSRVLPWVEYGTGGKYVVICPERGLLDFEPDSSEWFAWLSTLSSFRFTGKLGRFTAHRGGSKSPNSSWYATRSIRNRSYNHSLGKTEGLTIAHLDQVAAVLQSHLD